MPFKKLRRQVKNIAYTPVERKVREATNSDNAAPPMALFRELSNDTNDHVSREKIMLIITKRLDESRKHEVHIIKTLMLLRYLIIHGHDMVLRYWGSHYSRILKLFDFNRTENTDLSKDIRRMAIEIMHLIHDSSTVKRRRPWIVSSSLGSPSVSVSDSPSSAYKVKLSVREKYRRTKNILEAKEALQKFGEANAISLAEDLSKLEAKEAQFIREQEEENLKEAIRESVKTSCGTEKTYPDLPEINDSMIDEENDDVFEDSTMSRLEEIANDINSLNFYQPDPLDEIPCLPSSNAQPSSFFETSFHESPKAKAENNNPFVNFGDQGFKDIAFNCSSLYPDVHSGGGINASVMNETDNQALQNGYEKMCDELRHVDLSSDQQRNAQYSPTNPFLPELEAREFAMQLSPLNPFKKDLLYC